MSNSLKIGIFIPCYNVSKSIEKVLKGFSRTLLERIDEIVVVDNKSQDNTIDIVLENKSWIEQNGGKLTLIRNKKNYGLGGSNKIALNYFLNNGFTHFITIHGDGQGDTDGIISNFIAEYDKDKSLDIIMASRFHKDANISKYSHLRKLVNIFFNAFTCIAAGSKISDAGTAIFLASLKAIKDKPFMELSDGFHFNPQLNIYLYHDKTLKIKEIPLNWQNSQDSSNVAVFRYGFELLKILLEYSIFRSFVSTKKTANLLLENMQHEIIK